VDRRAKVELFEQIRREYEHGGGTIRGIADFDTLIWPPNDHLNWPPLVKDIYRVSRFGLSRPKGGPGGQESQGGAIRADPT